jgi:hypothetical protein
MAEILVDERAADDREAAAPPAHEIGEVDDVDAARPEPAFGEHLRVGPQRAAARQRAGTAGVDAARDRAVDAVGRPEAAPRGVADDDDLPDRRRQPAPRLAEAGDLRPALGLPLASAGTTRLPWSDTNRRVISGWAPSQSMIRPMNRAHPLWRSGVAAMVAMVSGQPELVSEMPCQRRRWATTSSAPRQWAAWLSPVSAIVPRASLGSTPNVHGNGGSAGSTVAQGLLGAPRASAGAGRTIVRSFGFVHPSRASAPKQRGVRSADATETTTRASTAQQRCQTRALRPRLQRTCLSPVLRIAPERRLL